MKYLYAYATMLALGLGLLLAASYSVYAGQTCVCTKIGNSTYCNCY
jgi:hypothetical protein